MGSISFFRQNFSTNICGNKCGAKIPQIFAIFCCRNYCAAQILPHKRRKYLRIANKNRKKAQIRVQKEATNTFGSLLVFSGGWKSEIITLCTLGLQNSYFAKTSLTSARLKSYYQIISYFTQSELGQQQICSKHTSTFCSTFCH